MSARKKKKQKSTMETVLSIVVAIGIAIILRSFSFEPFRIPSGSMLPTLQLGDYILVNKFSYGYSKYSFPFGIIGFSGRFFSSEPKRGDIIVFRPPTAIKVDYVKRLIGVPGDTIQYQNGRLYINKRLVDRQLLGPVMTNDVPSYQANKYTETLPNGIKHFIYEISDNQPLDNTEEYTIPQGSYFFCGDNRDNSSDSRVFHFVPFENLVGRVSTVVVSFDQSFHWYNPISWFSSIRYNRLFHNPNNLSRS